MEVESNLAIEDEEYQDKHLSDYYDRLDRLETEKEKREVLLVQSGSMAFEITTKCYTNCAECYTDKRANPKGTHLSLEEIVRRMEWIQLNTNVHTLYFFGGEPLLHPQMNLIFAAAREMGFQVEIISSGVTSKKIEFENRNRRSLYKAYEEGDINIELSFHPGRNEKAFKNIYKQLRKRADKREGRLRERIAEVDTQLSQARDMIRDGFDFPIEDYQRLLNLRKRLHHSLTSPALYSTMTIGEQYSIDEEKFKSIFKFLVGLEKGKLDNSTFTINDVTTPANEYIAAMFQRFKKHFESFLDSAPFNEQYDFTWSEKSTFVFKLWGAAIIKKHKIDGQRLTLIKRPMGTKESPAACPSMRSTFRNTTQIEVPNLNLRADGWLTYAEPSCIEVEEGLVNVNDISDPHDIYSQVRHRVHTIDKLIHVIDTTHNPDLKSGRVDDGNCTSCPFDSACRTCHRLKINRHPRSATSARHN